MTSLRSTKTKIRNYIIYTGTITVTNQVVNLTGAILVVWGCRKMCYELDVCVSVVQYCIDILICPYI